MMKVLVGYATVHGSTAEVAERIATLLTRRGHDVTVANVKTLTHLDGFQAFVLGTAIEAGTWLPEFKAFFKAFNTQLANKPIYIWVNSIRVMEEYGMSHVMDFYMVPELTKNLNVRSRTAFAGKLDLNKVDWDERWSLAARYDGHAWPTNFNGDFRDWNVIEDWATFTANDLQAVVANP
jgi:menaquinone-dependent protoporphyrinogen oxidase